MPHIKDFINSQEKGKELIEPLEILVSLAESKLRAMEKEIEYEFVNHKKGAEIQIVPDTNTDWVSDYRVNIEKDCTKEIAEVIDYFFCGQAKEYLKKIVTLALDDFIGGCEAGESKKKLFFLTVEHDTLIRVDVACWKCRFSNESEVENVENTFCYSFRKSIVDSSTVSKTVLLQQVSQLIGDDVEPVQEYLNYLEKMAKQSINNKEDSDVVKRLRYSMCPRYHIEH